MSANRLHPQESGPSQPSSADLGGREGPLPRGALTAGLGVIRRGCGRLSSLASGAAPASRRRRDQHPARQGGLFWGWRPVPPATGGPLPAPGARSRHRPGPPSPLVALYPGGGHLRERRVGLDQLGRGVGRLIAFAGEWGPLAEAKGPRVRSPRARRLRSGVDRPDRHPRAHHLAGYNWSLAVEYWIKELKQFSVG